MISSGGESVELTRYKEEICQTPWLTLASNTVCSIAHPAGLCVVRSACGVTARYPGCSECSSAALKSRDRHRQVDSRSRKGKINSSLSWNYRHWTSPSLLFEMSGCQTIVYLQLHLSHTVLGWRKEAAIFCWRMKESKSSFLSSLKRWNRGSGNITEKVEKCGVTYNSYLVKRVPLMSQIRVCFLSRKNSSQRTAT